MKEYLVVATFKEGVTPDEIRALIPEEQTQAKVLKEKGLIGFIRVAMPRKKVFIEAFGDNDYDIKVVIKSLPLSVHWDFEVYETTPPAGSKF